MCSDAPRLCFVKAWKPWKSVNLRLEGLRPYNGVRKLYIAIENLNVDVSISGGKVMGGMIPIVH